MNPYNFDGHKLMYHLDRVNEFLTKGDCYPLYIEISPVGSCNHRCVFCAYDYIGYPNRKLETNRTLELIDELAECGLRSILFAGEGEPLLHPDLARFIARAKRRGIDTGLFTNAQLLKPELAERILPDLTFIRCSFNGGTRENYARVHNVRPEVFDRVLANLREACAIKARGSLAVDIGAQFVLLAENMKYAEAAAAALRDAGLDYLAIKPFVQQSERQCYRQAAPLDDLCCKAVLDAAEGVATSRFSVIARRDSFNNYGKRRYSHCYGTSFISVLNSAGDIGCCLPYWDEEEYIFGNVFEESFRQIWQGERRKRLKMILEEQLAVAACPPNCRPNAVNDFIWEIRHPTVKHLNFI